VQEFSTILHSLESHAKTIPDKIAIIEAETEKKCTYKELWAYVKSFSKRLTEAGVKRDFGDSYGTRVVVRCSQTIDFVITSLAIQLAGGVFVPVEKNIADARIIEIMKETDCNIFIAANQLSNYESSYIPLQEASINYCDTDNDISFPCSDALSVILFTTGTSGKSKGVMLSHNASLSRVITTNSIYNHDNNQIWLIPSPLSHSSGLTRIFFNLFYQCTAVLLDGYMFAKSFFSAISKYNVTVIHLMSAASEMYLRTYRDKLIEVNEQINYIVLGGSSYTEIQIKSLREIFKKAKIIQTYGSTEVVGCYIDHSEQNYNSRCVGKPRDGTEIVFFNEQKTEIIDATINNPGLFAFNNDSKMFGYWKNTDLTASITRNNYIILSDLGYKGSDDLYYFLGRADDVIVSGAYKISPLEIETITNSLDSIQESVCIPVNDPIMGYVPKLYVVIKENYSFNFSEIYNHLKSRLETTKIPKYIEEINEIPKINNKINRKELKNK